MSYTLVSIKQITSKSSLKQFDCDIPALNEFLSRYALKNDELGIGKTFIALNNDNKILGYFTLATAQISFEDIPEPYRMKLPKYPIPALRLARLAVDKHFQGNGIGKELLRDVFKKILSVAEITAVKFIIVDAKETSKSFYEHYGFIRFSKQNLSYFIPIETVRMAVQS